MAMNIFVGDFIFYYFLYGYEYFCLCFYFLLDIITDLFEQKFQNKTVNLYI